MAKLILTKEEKEALTWFELDDATIGKLVKANAVSLINREDKNWETKNIWWWSAIILLVGLVNDGNVAKFTQEINNFTKSGRNLGNWRITVEKIK